MSTIHFNQTTALTPEQYVAGHTDVWERLHHDWSEYTLKRLPNGVTDVDVVIVREGRNAKGRILGLVLGTVGARNDRSPA